ncbi:hypothetical protein GCM10009550_61650 [Actinocorallia libanotica]|uniref:Uncharacterized protein n=1 Tax=Actinocorallia libanotica TaxID=46162 RepID=A0ABN1RV98_9ACTN
MNANSKAIEDQTIQTGPLDLKLARLRSRAATGPPRPPGRADAVRSRRWPMGVDSGLGLRALSVTDTFRFP